MPFEAHTTVHGGTPVRPAPTVVDCPLQMLVVPYTVAVGRGYNVSVTGIGVVFVNEVRRSRATAKYV